MKGKQEKKLTDFEKLRSSGGIHLPLQVFQLDCGWEVKIEQLYQSMTYASILVGYPTEEDNKRIISRGLEAVKAKIYCAQEPYLIPPKVWDIKLTDEDLGELLGYPSHLPEYAETLAHDRALFGELQILPRVECMADLSSSPVKDGDGSSLTVVWYQDHSALPIADEIIDQIKKLDWRKLAVDFIE
jgi:hypothetical protein